MTFLPESLGLVSKDISDVSLVLHLVHELAIYVGRPLSGVDLLSMSDNLFARHVDVIEIKKHTSAS